MEENIKKYLLKDFIKTYKRVPTKSELLELYNTLKRTYPNVEEIGLFASNIKDGEESIFYNAGSESDSVSVSKSLEQALLDLESLDKEYSALLENQREESIDQGRIFKNIESKINTLIKKINLQILLKGKQDIFSYGIVEDFSLREQVDVERSNVRILDNNKVSLSYLKSQEERLDLREVDFKVVHLRGNQLAYNRLGDIKNILEEDQKYYKVESASDIEDDVVEFIFNISFSKPKNIEQVKYKLQAIQNNSKLQEEVYYSVNGVDYVQLEVAGAVNSDINYIDFNNEDILYKKIIIKFRKTGFDYKNQGKFFYCLSFDYLSFVENTYKANSEGVLYLGPYEIFDEDGSPVNYSYATIKTGTCCIIPDKTSINFYLSKDGIDYLKCGFSNESSDVVAVDNSTNTNILNDFDIIDINSESEFLVDDRSLIDYEFGNKEQALNILLNEESQSKVNLDTLEVYRNVLTADKKVNGRFFSGWKKESNTYSCYVHLESGATVDFGSRTLLIDNNERSGKVFISQGTHKFEIKDMYFYQDFNEKSFTTERALARGDTHYPYNHKYLIEGFDYNNRFKGSKKYRKLGYLYASKLKSVTLDKFNSEENYSFLHILDTGGNKYLLIKDINADGRFEEYDIKYRNNSTNPDSNKLYLKAVLKSESNKVSPKIDQIQVRVI